MAGRRTLRMARVIKEVSSRAIICDLADPRLGFVTVTEVDVSPDMKTAKVKLSVLGDAKRAALCLQALRQARGRIQCLVASALSTKIVPRVDFELDDSVKKSVELGRLINLARSEYRTPPEGEGGAEAASDDAAEAAGDESPDEEPLDDEPRDEESPDEESPDEESPEGDEPDEDWPEDDE